MGLYSPLWSPQHFIPLMSLIRHLAQLFFLGALTAHHLFNRDFSSPEFSVFILAPDLCPPPRRIQTTFLTLASATLTSGRVLALRGHGVAPANPAPFP